MAGFPKIIVKRDLNSDAKEAFSAYAEKNESEEERKKRLIEEAKKKALQKTMEDNSYGK